MCSSLKGFNIVAKGKTGYAIVVVKQCQPATISQHCAGIAVMSEAQDDTRRGCVTSLPASAPEVQNPPLHC